MAVTAPSSRKASPVRHVGFLRHGGYRWLIVSILLGGAAAWGYRYFDFSPRPNGGTWYGYLLGTVGALLILWLTALGIRKRAITPGRWTLKGWVSAHVYLGVCLVVIATLHTGFQFGWNIHTAFYVLMCVVVGSGVLGVILYVTMPRLLSANREEMTERQILEQIADLDRQLHETALPLDQDAADAVRGSIERSPLAGPFLVRLFGLYGGCGTRRALARVRAAAPMASGELKAGLETLTGLLERKAAALRRARSHARIRAVLESWLYVHVPATFATLAAMVAHILAVFFYW